MSTTHGLIIGKFLPPHRGHLHLIETARREVDRLTVLVCSLKREPIAGERRVGWLRELCPGVEVLHHADENPSDPGEHPRFWEMWIASIRRLMPEGPDVVFSSEDYGHELARRLGARHVMVDRERRRFPTSGSAVREAPLAHWRDLPECVRPEYACRVVVTGPESTGKTTLASSLARRFTTVWVPEFARAHLDAKYAGRPIPSPPCEETDIPDIARGQIESEDVAARRSNRLVVCDTDLYSTCLYAEEFFGAVPSWVREEARRRPYALHLLLDADVPWVPDPQRDRPKQRAAMLERLEDLLEGDGRRFVRISGDWNARWLQAEAAVQSLLG